jgi:hypothetical protein
MLTLPRTIRTVERILVLNAFISTFYGTFAVAYLLVDVGLGNNDVLKLDQNGKIWLLLAAAKDSAFGGTAKDIIWKL